MMSRPLCFGLLFALLFTFTTCQDEVPEVELDCGTVKGTKTSTMLGDVYEFHQLPYAVPPVGPRRWTHSELLAPQDQGCWEGTYDASYQQDPPIKCLQYWNGSPDRGQEDCLYLSVRTPDISSSPSPSLPVLVWIHGGSLMSGWSDDPGYAPDAEFTADLNVVTVNINYRLDLMGFFSSPEIWNDEERQGNYGNFGIGDALTALRWIRENIRKFGGNPESVTLLGESSGGTVVLGLLVADQADGLFDKAIALSAPAKWESTYEDAYKRRSSFVADVGCTQPTEAERRECLKKMDVESLISHVDLNRGWGFYDFPYGSGSGGESMDYNVIEPTLIKVSPLQLREEENTENKKTKVTLVLSNTAQETGYNPLYYETNQIYSWSGADQLLQDKLDNLEQSTHFKVNKNLKDAIEKIYNFCDDESECDNTTWWPQIFYDTLTTDIRTTCITNNLVQQLNKNRLYDVYRMYITSRPQEKLYGLNYETIHGWDTEALFGYGWFQLASSNDRKQRKLEDNLRDLVEYICYDRDIGGWSTENTLVVQNQDFPSAISFEKKVPQQRECNFWNAKDMLQWGWQN